jgi:C4-dicarboxylate-specific signal transduction histidine kinase
LFFLAGMERFMANMPDADENLQAAASDIPLPIRRPLLDRCLMAIVATFAVAVVRWWLDPILGSNAAFAIFYISIIFTAWYSGLWPALSVMVLGLLIASFMFDSTRGDFFVREFRNQVGSAVYLTVGVYLIYLIDFLNRDIAQRKRMESELRASQENLQTHQDEMAHMARLSIMGEMAASLAHELNQPLHAAKNYARGSVRRLLKSPDRDPELVTALEHIADEADRAAEILRRVRDFVQKSSPNISAVSLNDLVQEAVKISSLELKRTRGRIVCELAQNIPAVRADAIQIEQVLVNLARNGLEAMDGLPEPQRVLRIGTRSCDNQSVEAFVADLGKGIGEQEMKKIFEPFFTTKADGMGMGLAISRSIIQSHEGRLWVSANADRGCTFHFTLPIAARK